MNSCVYSSGEMKYFTVIGDSMILYGGPTKDAFINKVKTDRSIGIKPEDIHKVMKSKGEYSNEYLNAKKTMFLKRIEEAVNKMNSVKEAVELGKCTVFDGFDELNDKGIYI